MACAHEVYGAFEYYSVLRSECSMLGRAGRVKSLFQCVPRAAPTGGAPDGEVRPAEFEMIWAQVNGKERLTAHIDVYNKARHLNQQVLSCSCTSPFRFLRTSKGVVDSDLTDVSDAVERLCVKHLRGCLDGLQDSNSFRDRHCYTMHTDVALQKHLHTLHNLYEFYADAAPQSLTNKLSSPFLMSVGEWLALEDMGFVDLTRYHAPAGRPILSHRSQPLELDSRSSTRPSTPLML